MKVVIIGGVAGGASAAARIRRLDEFAEIVVLERSGYVSYANCGMPYYVSGVITGRENLTLRTPESLWSRFHIDVRVRNEATAIDTQNKTVTVRELDTGREYTESYDKLILSPGAKALRPDLPGIDSARIFTLRTVEDTLRLRGYVEQNAPKSAVIAGGGYIAVEAAENLRELGVKVTLVQRPKQLMNTLDYDMACFIHTKMRENGVELRLGTAVAGFCDTESGIVTKLSGGESIKSDMVLLALGVVPDTALAKAAGIETGIKGSILVNERMETSAPDVYAVGDAVQVKHFVTGEDALISLAGPANKQGRIAADNVCGGSSVYKGTQGSSVVKVFDMTVAATGLTETAAKKAGIDCDSLVLTPLGHASYYPGAKALTLKVVYEKGSMRLLGAQVAGYQGVDKRADVLAAAIREGLTVPELAELELCYAPPYSSAKDPVNMAGFMAENLQKGLVKQVHWDEVQRLPRDGSVTLLDTRTPAEYARGHAEGFVNIQLDELRERIDEIPKEKRVIVMCQSGLRSYIACRILSGRGYDCANFSGGFGFYKNVILDQPAASEQR